MSALLLNNHLFIEILKTRKYILTSLNNSEIKRNFAVTKLEVYASIWSNNNLKSSMQSVTLHFVVLHNSVTYNQFPESPKVALLRLNMFIDIINFWCTHAKNIIECKCVFMGDKHVSRHLEFDMSWLTLEYDCNKVIKMGKKFLFFISFNLKQNTVTTMYLIHHYYNNDGDLIVSII